MPMSQADLAAELNKAQSTISSWLRGKTQPSTQDIEMAIDAIDEQLLEIQDQVEECQKKTTRIRSLLIKQAASKKKAKP